MVQLSRDTATINDTDYDNIAVSYIKITPVFDGVVDGFVCSYPIGQDIAVAKTEIKAKMTTVGILRDTEI